MTNHPSLEVYNTVHIIPPKNIFVQIVQIGEIELEINCELQLEINYGYNLLTIEKRSDIFAEKKGNYEQKKQVPKTLEKKTLEENHRKIPKL